MRTYKVICIPGDGIGQEVTPVGVNIVNLLGYKHGFQVSWELVDWGSNYFMTHGMMMPENGISVMSKFDAIFLGAVGTPEIPDHETLWGLLIPIRREFDQYINLRPVRSYEGIPGPLRSREQIDMLIVRENTEGEYSKIGGKFGSNSSYETALQVAVFSRHGIERVTKFAAEQARNRKKELVSATKSNGIIHSMPFWDEVVTEIMVNYPDVTTRSVLIDALAAALILHPEKFDVIVASNLFGDILSDLAAALVGSIGIAPSGNINPERRFPSMFEPVHGSAPDIAGQGLANPVGAIHAAAMMLEHFGEKDAAVNVHAGIQKLFRTGVSTRDLGGQETTESFTTKLMEVLNT